MIAYTTYTEAATKNIDLKKVAASVTKKDVLIKNLMFAGIIACLVLAVMF